MFLGILLVVCALNLVWPDREFSESENRMLEQRPELSLSGVESGRYMEQYEAQRIDLTGCTLDQVLYVINKGCPLIALTDTDHAVLLTGYTLTDITYIDPDEGGEYTVGINEMENMVQNGGNTFIGYIR